MLETELNLLKEMPKVCSKELNPNIFALFFEKQQSEYQRSFATINPLTHLCASVT